MPVTPIVKPFTGTSVQVLNAIRNSASTNYTDFIPFAQDNTESIREIGSIIMQYPALQNEFLSALMNRIGRVILTSKLYSNPWAMFKKGMLEYGETIEEIFVDLAKPYQFNPPDTADFNTRHIPTVKSAFHTLNYRVKYPVTVSNDQLRMAFLSWAGITDLISKIIESMYTAANYDEFLVMKYMLAKHILAGHLTSISIPPISSASMTEVAGVFRGTSNILTFMSSEYNIAGVKTHTEKSEQFLILNASFSGFLDTEVMASAFNLQYAEFMGHRVLVDSFGSLDNSRLAVLFDGLPEYVPVTEEQITLLNDIPAVLIDRNFFMIFDNYQNMTEQYYGDRLEWNYWYHVWKTFSVSPYSNALMFNEGTQTVTNITVTPTTATVNKGQIVTFTASVETTDFAPAGIIWTIDSTVSSIYDGVLTVSADETASTIVVTATSAFDSSKQATATVTVNP